MKWLFFLFVPALFATVNEPLRCEWFSGYRNDRVHWHLKDGPELLYSELYRDVEYWENGLTFKVIHRDLSFFVRGGYGTFGKGTLFQHLPGETQVSYGTEGWAADASGYFGYAINLTADRTYKVILTPLIGYGSHFELLQPENMRLAWYGFFFGGAFTAEPGGRLVLNAGYAYNLLHNRFHTSIRNASFQSVKANSTGDMGQTGWAQLDLILSPRWRMGIGGLINYFSTRVVEAQVREEGAVIHSQKVKLRWTAFSGWAQISREF